MSGHLLQTGWGGSFGISGKGVSFSGLNYQRITPAEAQLARLQQETSPLAPIASPCLREPCLREENSPQNAALAPVIAVF